MIYIFKGNLRGWHCSDCSEPLANVKVKLYRPVYESKTHELVAASQKETFRLLSPEEIKAREPYFIAETQVDDAGNFQFKLTEKEVRDGSATFDIDFECGSVPIKFKFPKPPKKDDVVRQFHITTLQAIFSRKNNEDAAETLTYTASFDISSSWFCRILALFGVFVICGQVIDCRTKIPVKGITVSAYDVDLIQDDGLGSDTTDAQGRYKIWYTRADFSKTIFDWLNVEWPAGPDVYFIVKKGTEILIEESRAIGNTPERNNISNCFCHDFCVTVINPNDPGGDTEPVPAFTRIGGYIYASQINSSPFGNGLTISGNKAFHEHIRLNGVMGKTYNGANLEYKIQYTTSFNSATQEPINWVDVPLAAIQPTWIGDLQVNELITDISGTYWNTAAPVPYYVNTVEVPIVAGWIQMPNIFNNTYDGSSNLIKQEIFEPNGNQLVVDTAQLAPFTDLNMTGKNSGVSSGPVFAINRFMAFRLIVREAGDSSTEVVSGTCKKIQVNNTKYDQVRHHPYWGGGIRDNEYGFCVLDVTEVESDGCKGVVTSLTLRFTVAHPNIASWSLGLVGPTNPLHPTGVYNLNITASSPTGESFGTATTVEPVPSLEDCAYLATLTLHLALTTGDSYPDPVQDQIAFCKSS